MHFHSFLLLYFVFSLPSKIPTLSQMALGASQIESYPFLVR
nr:MAG TPA: hypothetical protein [Caudoviricetes sp.]